MAQCRLCADKGRAVMHLYFGSRDRRTGWREIECIQCDGTGDDDPALDARNHPISELVQ
jgi:hypothetical protein